MDKNKFEEIFKKLNINYGKVLNKDILQFYYEYLKNINEIDFENIVDYIIKNDLFFPPVARFLEVKRMIEIRKKEIEEIKKFKEIKEKMEKKTKGG